VGEGVHPTYVIAVVPTKKAGGMSLWPGIINGNWKHCFRTDLATPEKRELNPLGGTDFRKTEKSKTKTSVESSFVSTGHLHPVTTGNW
jgi:hypothetical protein